ncbi:hypothetical protein XANCAGTX0491_004927 [Xanthoria calcicola]
MAPRKKGGPIVIPRGPTKDWSSRTDKAEEGKQPLRNNANSPHGSVVVRETEGRRSTGIDPRQETSIVAGPANDELTEHNELSRREGATQEEGHIFATRPADLTTEQGHIAQAQPPINQEEATRDDPDPVQETPQTSRRLWTTLPKPSCCTAVGVFFIVVVGIAVGFAYLVQEIPLLRPTRTAIDKSLSNSLEIQRLMENSTLLRPLHEANSTHGLDANLVLAGLAVGSLDKHLAKNFTMSVMIARRTGRCEEIDAARRSGKATLDLISLTQRRLASCAGHYREILTQVSPYLDIVDREKKSLELENPYSFQNMVRSGIQALTGEDGVLKEQKERQMDELESSYNSTNKVISTLRIAESNLNAEVRHLVFLANILQRIVQDFARLCESTDSESALPRTDDLNQTSHDSALRAAASSLLHALVEISGNNPLVVTRYQDLDE